MIVRPNPAWERRVFDLIAEMNARRGTRPRRASDFRDGDIVEVTVRDRSGRQPAYRGYGVVDSRLAYGKHPAWRTPRERLREFVYVRKLEGDISSGGWGPEQCRLVIRPPARRGLPVPENVILGED